MIFTGGYSAINAHWMMREQLQSQLNRHYNLAQIVHILHETYQPFSSISKLSIIPQMGVPVIIFNFPSLFFDFTQLHFQNISGQMFRYYHSVCYHNRPHYFASRIKPCTAWKFASAEEVSCRSGTVPTVDSIEAKLWTNFSRRKAWKVSFQSMWTKQLFIVANLNRKMTIHHRRSQWKTHWVVLVRLGGHRLFIGGWKDKSYQLKATFAL